MFTPAPMQRVNIFVQEEDLEQVVVALLGLEVVHLNEVEEPLWSGTQADHWSDFAARYDDQARRLEKLLALLGFSRQHVLQRSLPLTQPLKPGGDAADIDNPLREAQRQIEDWQGERREAEEAHQRLQRLIQEVQLLAPLDIPLEELCRCHYLHVRMGTVPKESLENLAIILFQIPLVIIPLHESADRILVFAATTPPYADILNQALQAVFIQPVAVSDEFSGSPAALNETLQLRLEQANARLGKLEQQRRRLVERWENRLLTLYHRVRCDQTVTETIHRLSRHERIYLIDGWVPRSRLEALVMALQETTEGRADLETLEPWVGGRRRAPTLIHNPVFLRPFERLVSIFGFPGYDEIDPTPLVALTFVLMYGMMFGDVGHGLLLTLVGLGLWLVKGRFRVIGAVVTVSALCATVFGFLYGSVLGREDILPALWLNPLQSIRDILMIAIIGGIIFINVGFVLQLVSAWISRDWQALLLGRSGLAGIVLYWGLFGGVLSLWQGTPLTLSICLVLGSAGLIFFHRPLTHLLMGERPLLGKNWGEYGVQAFFELFETIISAISNSLSFVRLGAFAIAHAGLSRMIFILADLPQSVALQWLVLALGTLLIVVFEGVIVGIQALRLEYYEFFSKFFQGTGRVFVPLRFVKVERA